MSPSAVWNLFTKTNPGEGKKVQVKCKTCNAQLSYMNSTTNMILHLKKVHNIEIPVQKPKGGKGKRQFGGTKVPVENEDDPPAPSCKRRNESGDPEAGGSGNSISSAPGGATAFKSPLLQCVNNMNAFSVGGPRDKECTNALLYMIAVDAMPLCTTERKGFRTFVQTLQPLYKVPSEPTVTKLLTEKYKVLRQRVGNMLEKAEFITLTADLWTHKATTRGYLGITAHFKNGTEIMSVELGARLMDERKTSANLRAAMRGMCEEWKINYDKVKAIVTDGGANIKAACKLEFGVEKHISCLAHQLNLIGQAAIGVPKTHSAAMVPSERPTPVQDPPEHESDEEDEEQGEMVLTESSSAPLQALLKKVKRTVTFFKKSEIATSMLLDLQRTELQKSEDKLLKLIQEVLTRWNSSFQMIDRY